MSNVMRKTKQHADQARNDILIAAELLFLERGVAHTSLEHIARQAGVTRGAVYWHFKNKAYLFHVLLNQVRLPTELVAQRIKSCDPKNPLVGLRNICIQTLPLWQAYFDSLMCGLIDGWQPPQQQCPELAGQLPG